MSTVSNRKVLQPFSWLKTNAYLVKTYSTGGNAVTANCKKCQSVVICIKVDLPSTQHRKGTGTCCQLLNFHVTDIGDISIYLI